MKINEVRLMMKLHVMTKIIVTQFVFRDKIEDKEEVYDLNDVLLE